MNIIHSSSLTHYPAAYSKLNSAVANNGDGQARTTGNQATTELGNRPSSPEQIEAALAENGLTQTASNASNNIRIQKALNAYTTNNNQIAQHQVAGIISRVDLRV